MSEEEIFNELSMCVPIFEYDNGVAYNIAVNSDLISFTYTNTGELSVYSLGRCYLATNLIFKVIDMLELKLEEEISSNKLNWYCKYI